MAFIWRCKEVEKRDEAGHVIVSPACLFIRCLSADRLTDKHQTRLVKVARSFLQNGKSYSNMEKLPQWLPVSVLH